jgi:hypothetical protein
MHISSRQKSLGAFCIGVLAGMFLLAWIAIHDDPEEELNQIREAGL